MAVDKNWSEIWRSINKSIPSSAVVILGYIGIHNGIVSL